MWPLRSSRRATPAHPDSRQGGREGMSWSAQQGRLSRAHFFGLLGLGLGLGRERDAMPVRVDRAFDDLASAVVFRGLARHDLRAVGCRELRPCACGASWGHRSPASVRAHLPLLRPWAGCPWYPDWASLQSPSGCRTVRQRRSRRRRPWLAHQRRARPRRTRTPTRHRQRWPIAKTVFGRNGSW